MHSKDPGLLYGSVQMGHIRNYYIFSFQKWSMLEHKIFSLLQINCVPHVSSILTMWQRRAFSPRVLQSTSCPAISMHCHTWPLCQIVWELSCAGFLCFQLLLHMHTCVCVCMAWVKDDAVPLWCQSLVCVYHKSKPVEVSTAMTCLSLVSETGCLAPSVCFPLHFPLSKVLSSYCSTLW